MLQDERCGDFMDEFIPDFDEKVSEIDEILAVNIRPGSKVVIWGGQEHTNQLLLHTNVMMYNPDIIDEFDYGHMICQILVQPALEYDFSTVDVVIISSVKHQDEVEQKLKNDIKFKNKIIKFYDTCSEVPFYKLQNRNMFITLKGTFENWDEAAKYCKDGNAKEEIFNFERDEAEKHRQMYLDGKTNDARAEFDILIYIYACAVKLNRKKLKVLDYGGGFASMYYDLKHFFDNTELEIQWVIIDQKRVVKYAKNKFEDNTLKFAADYDEAWNILDGKCDIVMFNGCLQYIKDYEIIQERSMAFNPYMIMILRTPVIHNYEDGESKAGMTTGRHEVDTTELFNEAGIFNKFGSIDAIDSIDSFDGADKPGTMYTMRSHVKVQSVNENSKYNCYTAMYPVRVFSIKDLLQTFYEKYKITDEYKYTAGADNNLREYTVKWENFILEKRQ